MEGGKTGVPEAWTLRQLIAGVPRRNSFIEVHFQKLEHQERTDGDTGRTCKLSPETLPETPLAVDCTVVCDI